MIMLSSPDEKQSDKAADLIKPSFKIDCLDEKRGLLYSILEEKKPS